VIWGGAFAPGFGVYAPPFPLARPAIAPLAPLPQPAADELDKPEVKPTNADTKARAGKFIGYGDALFAKQNYLAAAARYRTAAGIAADMAEPSMRNGFAQVALGNYETAAKSFRRGLSIRPDWSESPFRLNDLYGGGAVAKTGHIESLAAAVEANNFDSELITVLAIELYFDGQRDRAEMFFVRAAQLGANSDHLFAAFLPRPAPAGAAKPGEKPAQPVQNNKGPAKVVF
jgi:tetratricopeptide (TPR) repeat protein